MSRETCILERHYNVLYLEKHQFLADTRSDDRASTRMEKTQQAVFHAFQHFLDTTFPEVESTEESMRGTRQASYKDLWLLFKPGSVVYENKSIPPYATSYEQCYRVEDIYYIHSPLNGCGALRIELEEFIYKPNSRIHGPSLALTSAVHFIPEYAGTREVTTANLGLTPFEMLSVADQESISIRLAERACQYLRLCTMPPSVRNYSGPLSLAHDMTGESSAQEMKPSPNERLWQVCDKRRHCPYRSQK